MTKNGTSEETVASFSATESTAYRGRRYKLRQEDCALVMLHTLRFVDVDHSQGTLGRDLSYRE